MSFLTLNGIDIGVAMTGGAGGKIDPIGGGVTRAADGSPRLNYLATKRHPKFKTSPQAADRAFFLERLLVGAGDHVPFDTSTASDKGAAATTAGTAPTIISAGPAPKRGAAALKIVSGVGNTITWSVGASPEGWTVALWVSQNAGAWHHYIVSAPASGGPVSVWLDGVAQAPGIPAWLVVDAVNGTVQLRGVAGGSPGNDFAFDDLAFVPAPMPTSWAASVYAFMNAQAWPFATRLVAAGDFHLASLTVIGDPSSIEIEQLQAAPGGVWTDNLRTVSFDLLQV